MSASMVICVLGGALLGLVFIPDDWSVGRRLAAGAMSGAGVALIILMNRMLGAYVEPEVDVREKDEAGRS